MLLLVAGVARPVDSEGGVECVLSQAAIDGRAFIGGRKWAEPGWAEEREPGRVAE